MRTWILPLAVLSLLTILPAQAGEVSLEHQVKIAFLYNFAKFIEWPGGALPDASSPMTLGIIGDDPFCREVELSLQGKSVNGRPLVVRRLRSDEAIPEVRILFIGASPRREVARILAGLREAPVLTVGDIAGFAGSGGIIGFWMEENKVRFEINLAAARRAGLKISSRLLGVARVLQGDDAQGDSR